MTKELRNQGFIMSGVLFAMALGFYIAPHFYLWEAYAGVCLFAGGIPLGVILFDWLFPV
jgi:hypothetical protein